MATKFTRIFVWILMGMVLVGLVGFGSFNFGGRADSIGTVGKATISANQYFREMNNEINAFQNATGQNLTFAQAQAFGLDQQVLNRVISAAAYDNETAELGLSVGDAEIARQVKEIDAFKGVNGTFDREMYDFALSQSGLTASEFEASLRADVSRTILQGAVANGIAVRPTYTDTLYNWARETRDFSWVRVDGAMLDTPVGTPDEAALQAYYDANPDMFTLPETKAITYVWVSPEDMIPTIEVDEAELRTMYNARIDEYMVPERRLVERLAFGTEAEAQAAADQLAAGEITFEDLVAARDLDLSDVDLGDVTEADLGPAGAAVFAMTEPGVIGPVDSNVGPAVIRMNAILAAQETTFDAVRDDLHAEYAADTARRVVDDLVPTLDDDLAAGATLEDLARDHNLTLGTIDWTAASQDGIAAYDNFRATAAAVLDGDYPEIAELSDGGVFALRLDDTIAPRLQAPDEVRDQAIAGWVAAETQARVVEKANTLMAALNDGTSTLADLDLTKTSERDISRDGAVNGIPPALLATVFDAEPGTWHMVEDVSGAILVQLDLVIAPDQTTDEARSIKASFNETMSQQIALDVQTAFASALESAAGIELDRAVINAVNANFP